MKMKSTVLMLLLLIKLSYQLHNRYTYHITSSSLSLSLSKSLSYSSPGSGKEYFREISSIFEVNGNIYSNNNDIRSEAHDNLIKELREFILKNHINAAHMSNIIKRCAKSKIDITNILDMKTILEKLSVETHNVEYTSIELAQLLYGLKSLRPTSSGIDLYLDFVLKKLEESHDPWKGQEVGNSLYGFQFFSNSEKIDSILNLIGHKIKSQIWKSNPIPITLNGQEFSNACYGMRKLSSDNIATLSILDAIRLITEQSNNIILNQQGFGNSLNGLQGMNSDEEIVRKFIKTITPLIDKADLKTIPLEQRSICGALMGMRSFSSSHQEVLDLLRIVAAKFRESNIYLSSNHICHALSSLKNYDNRHIEVKQLLSLITQRIKTDQFEVKNWTPEIVANSLTGLRKMTIKNDKDKNDLSTLLTMISNHVSTSSDPREYYTSLDISKAVMGIQSISASQSEAVKDIIGKLAVEIEKTNSITRLSSTSIACALHGLKAQTDSTIPEIKSILNALSKSIERCNEPFSSRLLSMSMIGLSSLSPSQELYSIVGSISDKIEDIDGVCIGSMVYALKKKSSDAPEVKKYLKALTHSIRLCKFPIQSQHFASAYYGLCSLDNVHAEVTELVQVLNEKVEASPSLKFNSQGISNAISGFQSMQLSSTDNVISSALEMLADKLEDCNEIFSAANLANIIFGLQGMSCDVKGARAVLVAVLPKMLNSIDKFTERDIGYCLAGLSTMQNNMCDESKAVLSELNFKVVQAGFGDQPVLQIKMYGRGVKLIKQN